MRALVMLMLLIPITAQDTPGITVTEVDPATITAPAEAWLYETFEQANDTWAWCGFAHRTDWPYSPNGAYHAYLGGYVQGVDGLIGNDLIRTDILADPQVWCWDWMMKSVELPYRIDVAVANLYQANGDFLVGVWERDNRDADGQWRRFCVEISGLSQYPGGVRLYWAMNNDFSNATSLHIDNVAWVADRKYPAPGPEHIYLPVSIRQAKNYQKCRECILQPSGSIRTVCNIVDSCAGATGYPPCPALPGLFWQWQAVRKYCVRY